MPKTFYELSNIGLIRASNGLAESRSSNRFRNMRLLKDALETCLGVTVASNHNILCDEVVEFAGTLINRYEVGHDGKTVHMNVSPPLFVLLCDTAVCFLHAHEIGTQVPSPKIQSIPPDVDFQFVKYHAQPAS